MNTQPVAQAAKDAESEVHSNRIIWGAFLLVAGVACMVASYHPMPNPSTWNAVGDALLWIGSIGMMTMGIETLITSSIDYNHSKIKKG